MIRILIFTILIVSNSYASDVIVFLGDSLTKGYGVEDKYSFPSLIQEKLNKDNKKYKVINGGVSGSTTASGLSRAKWFIKSKPKLVVLALGANDGLRGLDIKQSEDNLNKIIQFLKNKGIIVILAGMQMPPNYGKDYVKKFRSIYPRLAKKNNVELIPFLIEGVAGKKEFNLQDGIHPNQKGYEIIANKIYPYIKEYL